MNLAQIDVIAPNLKHRLSGVTATIVRLVSVQAREIGITTTGPGLPADLPHLALWRLPFLPRDRWRVWHARRNNELLVGLVLRDLLRRKLRVVFTSSSPRRRGRWTRFLLGRCDRIIATSAANAAVMPGRCAIIPHGVDTEAFHPAPNAFFCLPGQKLVGCFGRIRPKKGTADFVAAMCALLPAFPGWSAVIMGRVVASEATFAEGLRKQIDAAGLHERIVLANEIPVQAMAAAYNALSIYVAPSHLEGFGLTVLEAMACGVPVVGSRGVGAFDDMVAEGETGALFAPGDAGALTEALGAIMAGPARAASMGRAARARAQQHFSIAAEAAALNALYRELLA